MLEISTQKFVDLNHGELIHLHRAVNDSLISPELGAPAEPCTAALIVLRKPDHLMVVFLGLYFLKTGRRVLYTTKAFQAELLEEKILSCEGFAGEMGFLLENTRYNLASEDEKTELLQKHPFFGDSVDAAAVRQSKGTSEAEVSVEIELKQSLPSESAADPVLKLLSMI